MNCNYANSFKRISNTTQQQESHLTKGGGYPRGRVGVTENWVFLQGFLLIKIKCDDTFGGKYEHSNGKILPTLMNLSDVAKVLGTVGPKAQNKVGKILVDKIVDTYAVTGKEALVMAKISSGASIAAAEHFSLSGGSRKKSVDTAVQFILGAMETFKK